jgi:hypothetical protein
VPDRLQRLADDARALCGAEDAGAALLGFIDRLIDEATLKRDLVDALATAGSDVNAAVTATAADLRREISYLLVRAQHSNAIRSGTQKPEPGHRPSQPADILPPALT